MGVTEPGQFVQQVSEFLGIAVAHVLGQLAQAIGRFEFKQHRQGKECFDGIDFFWIDQAVV